MKSTRIFCWLLAVSLVFSQCQKNDPHPEDQLPEATQTGANTIGFLVNGEPWTPAGFDGSSNYSVAYDPNPYGILNLRTYRYPIPSGKNFESLQIFARNLRAAQTYDIRDLVQTRITWNNTATGCEFNSDDPGTYHKGTLTITKLDLRAGIISGTFDFKLAKPGCDTVRITHGRFDKRL
jgi:hypothetical protein